jgi:hydrogenase nickel incorporation protein HypB
MWMLQSKFSRHFHHREHRTPPTQSRHQESQKLSAGKSRRVQVVRRVLDSNDIMADRNRKHFNAHNVFVLNMMSSPGSGKTTTLRRTLEELMPDIRCGVIVGDICTTHDADLLAASGAPVVQVNTDEFGGDCHLAAHVIETAMAGIDLDAIDLLIVENIGNLVCPAEFDIGEDRRVVVLSVTEGEDKPAKYPLMFRVCDALLLNKIDLLPYLDYDKEQALNSIDQIHPDMPVFEISAKSGQGFDAWIQWLRNAVKTKQDAIRSQDR